MRASFAPRAFSGPASPRATTEGEGPCPADGKEPHELMHALEVLNLIDLGELLFVAASERKETRKKHVRADYPFTNPLLEKLLIVKRSTEKP